jgi:hypothetical protein
VDSERRRLTHPAPAPVPDIPPSENGFRLAPEALELVNRAHDALDWITIPDARTEEEFDAELEQYLSHGRKTLEGRLHYLLQHHGPQQLLLYLANKTERAFVDVQIVVTIPGAWSPPTAECWPRLPQSPRRWKERIPRSASFPESMYLGSYGGLGLRALAVAPPPKPAVEVTHTDTGVRLTFTPVDLRPRDSKTLVPVTAVPIDPSQARIQIEWGATAMNASGTSSGVIPINVVPSTLVFECITEDCPPGKES